MRRRSIYSFALALPLTLSGCYTMQDEHVLVLDSMTQRPVAGVLVNKKPLRFPWTWSAVPLPKASQDITDDRGLATLKVPRNHGLFRVSVRSDDYETDKGPDVPATRPADVDEVYYVRRR